MTSQLTTELMAGKGPDIITSGELSLLSLSTEKLIKQGVFANIDDIISNSEDKDKLNYPIIILIFLMRVFTMEKIFYSCNIWASDFTLLIKQIIKIFRQRTTGFNIR